MDLPDLVELLGALAREQVRDAGRGAHAEDRGEAGLPEARVALELHLRHVEQAAHVDVVGAGEERGLHDVEVHLVLHGVHDHEGTGEHARRAGVIAHVDARSADARLPGPRERGRQRLGLRAVEVGDEDLVLRCAGLDEIPHRDPPHRAGPSDHRERARRQARRLAADHGSSRFRYGYQNDFASIT